MSTKAFSGVPLRCSKCGLPFARVQNSVLIVESKHRGETHVNVIPVATIVELAGMIKYDDDQSNSRLAGDSGSSGANSDGV